ncbi:hypothetical protein [Niveispirillum lacus]|nr:hypothetical protein [Niveispirillum lacus]
MTPNLAGLTLKQRQAALNAAMLDPDLDHPPSTSNNTFHDATASPRLMEGYNSRAADEITWAKIAFHLAAGVPIIKIAEHYKLSRTTIWRAISQSPNLRRRIAEERALMRREADSRFVAMRELVVDTLYRAVADGNMRATIWAAERLGIGDSLLQRAEKPPRAGNAHLPDIQRPPAARHTTPPPETTSALSPATVPDPDATCATDPVAPPPDPVPAAAPASSPPTRSRPSTATQRQTARTITRPVPRHPQRSRLTALPRRARPSVRVLAWLLHNAQPTADGADGVPGLAMARLVAQARWLALTGKHKVQ